MTNNAQKLMGGNMSSVYKQKDTVLREQKEWSPTIHKLLLHLERVGLPNSPTFLGIDENGMEILSFMQGKCVEDYPFIDDEDKQLLIIKTIAEIMRKYHDATLSFKQTAEDNWMFSYKGSLEKEVICHNDIAPYNVTFIDGIPHGLIDFDTCCPAPRIWDIVYTLYRFAPFSESVYDIKKHDYRNYDAKKDRNVRKKSINTFFKAYDMKQPDDLFEQMTARLQALADLIYSEAKNGKIAFQKMLEEGHRDLYLREIEFIRKHTYEWV